MKIYSNKLASLLAVVVAATVLQTVQAEETCHDVWAYESEHDICIEQMGASYWGWTNGRFGTSNCDACNCPVCPGPTPAPTPVPVAVTLPQQCSGISASWSGDPHFKTFDGLKYVSKSVSLCDWLTMRRTSWVLTVTTVLLTHPHHP